MSANPYINSCIFFLNVAGKVNSFIACSHFRRVSWYEQNSSLLTTCCDSIHREVLSEAFSDTEFYSVEGGPLNGSHGAEGGGGGGGGEKYNK